MAVLSDVDIKKIIAENKGIIIMNMCENNLTALGYDFTIGFICDSDTGAEPKKIECIRDIKLEKEYKTDEFFNDRQLVDEFEKYQEDGRYRFGHRYELSPGKRYLVISEEYIALLEKYMATVHSRGSYSLKGIIVTSTSLDPNYQGFVYASLLNGSNAPVYIKEHNQFATMVIQTLTTPTKTPLAKTEGGSPKDAAQTLKGRFSNINEAAATAAIKYGENAEKKIRQEFQEKYSAFKNNSSDKPHFGDWFPTTKRLLVEKGFLKWVFLIGVILIILVFLVYYAGV